VVWDFVVLAQLEDGQQSLDKTTTAIRGGRAFDGRCRWMARRRAAFARRRSHLRRCVMGLHLTATYIRGGALVALAWQAIAFRSTRT